MKFILCMIISFLSNTALEEEKIWPGSPPDCWRESRNVHSYDDFHSLIEQNIKITNRAAKKPSQGEISPNKAYLFIKKNSRPRGHITVYSEKPNLTDISFTNIFGLSDVKWINEKLTFYPRMVG